MLTPGFAILARDSPQLLLSIPTGPGGAARPMPHGRTPEPGGGNRIPLELEGLEAEVDVLREEDVRFRNEIVSGHGGKQILLDPAGNPIELFQPAQR